MQRDTLDKRKDVWRCNNVRSDHRHASTTVRSLVPATASSACIKKGRPCWRPANQTLGYPAMTSLYKNHKHFRRSAVKQWRLLLQFASASHMSSKFFVKKSVYIQHPNSTCRIWMNSPAGPGRPCGTKHRGVHSEGRSRMQAAVPVLGLHRETVREVGLLLHRASSVGLLPAKACWGARTLAPPPLADRRTTGVVQLMILRCMQCKR